MCTEKSYGGNNGVREHSGKIAKDKGKSDKISTKLKLQQSTEAITSSSKKINDNEKELNDYKKAGEIANKIRDFARNLIKPGMPLLEIAKKIEKEIENLGGIPAFPVNLSINEIAAHYHPTLEDQALAQGLLKVDIGIQINGFIADTAFSMDLTPEKKYKELIKASEEALENALNLLNKNPSLTEIGKTIKETIEKKGFSPIINLSGHELKQYDVHAGITIPNYANNSNIKLEEGAYAIEPFATTGEGKVIDGQSSNIFKITTSRNPRNPTARKILEYVSEKYKTLPFSLREMQEKFGPMARLGLKELEQIGAVHNFPQLIEKSRAPVSQAEHTFIKTKDGKIIVTTR
ncbi:type II methionyl aminopeptidase [Candidatus Pacearchaeota archaeon]|nr:type II methionyl aminopeptidase [Candidatus Pacearchaeota archaeon]